MRYKPLISLLFLFVEFSGITTYAQDCKTSSLLTPGTELVYHTFWPNTGFLGRSKGDFLDATILVYHVERVEDKDGVVYSYVNKTGSAFNNPGLYWQSQLVLKCTGTGITFPADYYASDTIYLCDLYPAMKKDTRPYSAAKSAGTSMEYPMVAENNAILNTGSYEYNGVIHDPNAEEKLGPNYSKNGASFNVRMTMVILSRKVVGKEKIRTRAGEFDCYKILITTKKGEGRRGAIYTGYEYFSPLVGVVRIEKDDGANKGVYLELIRVDKK